MKGRHGLCSLGEPHRTQGPYMRGTAEKGVSMGAELEHARELDARYVIPNFARKNVLFSRGEGAVLFDDEGRRYLDFLSGIGVVSVGHCNPAVTDAICRQAETLVHVGNYFHIERRGELARRISGMLSAMPQGHAAGVSGIDSAYVPSGDVDSAYAESAYAESAYAAPADEEDPWQVFFANSGAEANEGAIKLARLWGAAHPDASGTSASRGSSAVPRAGIVTAKASFHGRTLASLAATGQTNLHAGFEPLPAGFAHVPLGDIDALREALDAPLADGTLPVAVMLECIQGESGVWPCTPEYLRAARELTAERGMLLIADEVQTGFCRTGEYFCFQAYGVEPDIVTMAKGIAGGIPMGAFAARRELASLMGPGTHGSTFGGSNIAVAAADAVTSLMCEEDFLSHVREVGAHFREALGILPFVTDVRGMGLMTGVTLERPVAGALVDAGLAAAQMGEGFVLNAPAADILRFLPPLVITVDEVDRLIDALPALFEEVCHD